MNSIIPVVLSGGSGTRLWPLSRSMYPKQFIRFFNGRGTTLLGATLHLLAAGASFNLRTRLANATASATSPHDALNAALGDSLVTAE